MVGKWKKIESTYCIKKAFTINKENKIDESTFISINSKMRNKSPVGFQSEKNYVKFRRYAFKANGSTICSVGIAGFIEFLVLFINLIRKSIELVFTEIKHCFFFLFLRSYHFLSKAGTFIHSCEPKKKFLLKYWNNEAA